MEQTCKYCNGAFDYPSGGISRKMCRTCYNHRGRTIYNKNSNKNISKNHNVYELEVDDVTADVIIDFVGRIESDKLWVTIYDISSIITLYTSIADRLYDYDRLKPGEQIQMMWKDLVKYRDKRIHQY